MQLSSLSAELADVGFQARKTAHWFGSRSVVTGFKLLSGATLGKYVQLLQSGAVIPALTEGLLLGGIGLSAGARAYMAYQDHEIEQDRLTNFYRAEVAASLGKDPKQVSIEDLRTAAERNPVLEEALERNDKHRNSRIFSWVAGTLLVGAGLLFGGYALLVGAVGATAALPVAIVANIALTQIAKRGLEKVSDKVLGIDTPPVHDYIYAMHQEQRRGHNLSQEQVMQVFLEASPMIADRIEAEYGAPFKKLDVPDKIKVLKEYGTYYHIPQVTSDINTRRIDVAELAYLAVGQRSGVEPRESPLPTLYSQAQDSVSQAWEQAKGHVGNWRSAYKHGGVKELLQGNDPSAPETVMDAAEPTLSSGWAAREDARRVRMTDMMPEGPQR